MNRHQKLALVVAPFLIVFGYIGADYYAEYKQSEELVYELELNGNCVLTAGNCILEKDQFQLEVFNRQGHTQIASNHPLTSAVLSRVREDDSESAFQMTTDEQRKAWSANTGIVLSEAKDNSVLLRLIVSVDNTFFFKEFNASVAQ